jgi:hypothetical protein
MQDVIQAIEAAEDKDTLERIGRDVLSVEVDKRKGMETIRKQLLNKANGMADDSEGEQSDEDTKPKQRRMRHRVTGRILLWTKHLDKHPDMVEIEEG